MQQLRPRVYLGARMASAVDTAMNLPARTHPIVRPKQITQSGRALHAPAAPGPWGLRNSYICSMLADPRGPSTLAKWTKFWASGTPSASVARVWESRVTHPFYKPDGAEVRPVVCSEALLKFPAGCVFFAILRACCSCLRGEAARPPACRRCCSHGGRNQRRSTSIPTQSHCRK